MPISLYMYRQRRRPLHHSLVRTSNHSFPSAFLSTCLVRAVIQDKSPHVDLNTIPAIGSSLHCIYPSIDSFHSRKLGYIHLLAYVLSTTNIYQLSTISGPISPRTSDLSIVGSRDCSPVTLPKFANHSSQTVIPHPPPSIHPSIIAHHSSLNAKKTPAHSLCHALKSQRRKKTHKIKEEFSR